MTTPGVWHNFYDDLESLLYILLWTTMMFLKVIPKKKVPPFLTTVLDPQCYNDEGSIEKADFLKGKTLLPLINFPGHPTLFNLINNLCNLFWFRYKTPSTKAQVAHYQQLSTMLEFCDIYEAHYCTKYYPSMGKLQNQAGMIKLFETTLNNHSGWPDVEDPSKEQFFKIKGRTELVIKSAWLTSYVMRMM
jgi:hypothetical protein